MMRAKLHSFPLVALDPLFPLLRSQGHSGANSQLPRVRYKTYGAKTVNTPWIGKNSHFSLLFKAFAAGD